MNTTPPNVVAKPPAAVPVARVIALPPMFETSTMGVAFTTVRISRYSSAMLHDSTGRTTRLACDVGRELVLCLSNGRSRLREHNGSCNRSKADRSASRRQLSASNAIRSGAHLRVLAQWTCRLHNQVISAFAQAQSSTDERAAAKCHAGIPSQVIIEVLTDRADRLGVRLHERQRAVQVRGLRRICHAHTEDVTAARQIKYQVLGDERPTDGEADRRQLREVRVVQVADCDSSSQLGPGIHFAASEGSGKTGLTARKGDGYEGHGRGCGCGGWRMDVS